MSETQKSEWRLSLTGVLFLHIAGLLFCVTFLGWWGIPAWLVILVLSRRLAQ